MIGLLTAEKADTELNMETALRSQTPEADEHPAVRLRFLVPIAAFAGLMLTFVWALNRTPSTIPSALIGQQVPPFALPALKSRPLGPSPTPLESGSSPP